MITLELLGEVCQNCPHFEVEQDTKSVRFIDGFREGKALYYTVTCRHITKCRDITLYLQKEIEKNGN